MAYVVSDPCIRCKHKRCVEVCPVDCFHEGPWMLVIDPEECIDCGACWTACPSRAVLSADDGEAAGWREHNAFFARRWPEYRTPPLRRRTEAVLLPVVASAAVSVASSAHAGPARPGGGRLPAVDDRPTRSIA